MFPTAARLASAIGLLAAGVICTTATAAADDDPPPAPLHNVHYTIWAEQPYHLDVYYHDTDPPNWGDYSHNPYQFTPKVTADVGPDHAVEPRRRAGGSERVGDGGGQQWTRPQDSERALCARGRRRGRRDQSGSEGRALLDPQLVIDGLPLQRP